MTVRYLVDDVDAALPFYRALGFRLADRWGPPFAVMKGKGLTLWLAGPGTSARKKLAERRAARTRRLEPHRRRDEGPRCHAGQGARRGRQRAQQADQGAGRAAGAGGRSVGESGGGV